MKNNLMTENREPSLWEKAKTGVLVDAGLIRHLICNAEQPWQMSEDDFYAALCAVLAAVQMAPAEEVREP